MMIPKGSEIKLNVRPIFIGLVHEASYEGPCRFGEGKTLEVGYDRFLNPEMFKQFVKSCEDNIPDCAQIVDPLMVERTDNWDSPEAMFEAMIGDRENIDLYLFSAGMGRADIMIDFALRYHVPVALNPASNFGSGSNAALYYRGIETYTEFSWDDMRSRMRALQARKAIRKTRVMSLPRFQTAYSAGDSFIDLNKITQKFGTVFRSRNLHEFLDQMTPAVEGGNPTTPGRVTWDIDDNDEVEIERIARELVENADEVDIKPEYVRSAVVPYVLAKKYLDVFDCNAFVAPCPDSCSTRRLHEQNFTFCLTHSLLTSEGIPSACEYDMDAAVTMQALMAISHKSAFMGNSGPISVKDGKAVGNAFLDTSQLDKLDDVSNLYLTQHSVATLKMNGFESCSQCYALRHFAYEKGFGAVIRHDYGEDAGQIITVARFSPDGEALFVGKGEVVAGGGYDRENCHGDLIYRVVDNMDFAHKQKYFGNHLSVVYGDYTQEMIMLGECMGLKVVTA